MFDMLSKKAGQKKCQISTMKRSCVILLNIGYQELFPFLIRAISLLITTFCK